MITGDALYALRLPSNAAVQVRPCCVRPTAAYGFVVVGLPLAEG